MNQHTGARKRSSLEKQHILAMLLAFVFAGCGIADVVLRCVALGWYRGLVIAANDPAKALFHIYILPLAVYILLRRIELPWTFVRNAPTAVAGGAILCLGILIPLSDAHQIFCSDNDPPQPEDIRDASVRTHLATKHETLFQQIHRERTIPETIAEAEYLELVQREARAHGCYAFSQSSLRFKIGVLLTMFATVSAAFLFFLPLAYLFRRKRLEAATLDDIVMTVALFALWPPLRAYSDWYLNFGRLDFRRLTFGVFVIVLACLMLGVGKISRPARAVAAAMTAAATSVMVVGAVSPSLFESTANWLSTWDITQVVAGYILFVLSSSAVVWYLA
jgi:hypothetical protein